MLSCTDSSAAREGELHRLGVFVRKSPARKVDRRAACVVQLYPVGVFAVAVRKTALVLRADLVDNDGRLGCTDDIRRSGRQCRCGQSTRKSRRGKSFSRFHNEPSLSSEMSFLMCVINGYDKIMYFLLSLNENMF